MSDTIDLRYALLVTAGAIVAFVIYLALNPSVVIDDPTLTIATMVVGAMAVFMLALGASALAVVIGTTPGHAGDAFLYWWGILIPVAVFGGMIWFTLSFLIVPRGTPFILGVTISIAAALSMLLVGLPRLLIPGRDPSMFSDQLDALFRFGAWHWFDDPDGNVRVSEHPAAEEPASAAATPRERRVRNFFKRLRARHRADRR